MNQTTAFSNIGTVRIAPYNASIPFHNRAFLDTGNTDQLDFTIEEEVVELADAREQGGVDGTMRRVKALSGSMKLRHISEFMFANMLQATATTLAAGTVTDEPHVARAGAFVPLNHLIDLEETITVKKGATALDEADWSVDEHGTGIIFAETFATSGLTTGDAVLVTYTRKAQYDIEALVTSAPLVSIHCAGENAYNGKKCTDKLYKVRLGAVQNFTRLHNGQFGEITISFTGERAAEVSGAGASKYYKHTEES